MKTTQAKSYIYLGIDEDTLDYIKVVAPMGKRPVKYQQLIQAILNEWVEKHKEENREFSFLTEKDASVLENIKKTLQEMPAEYQHEFRSKYEKYEK